MTKSEEKLKVSRKSLGDSEIGMYKYGVDESEVADNARGRIEKRSSKDIKPKKPRSSQDD